MNGEPWELLKLLLWVLPWVFCYIKLKKRLWILLLAHTYMDTILMVQMYFASN